MLLLSVLYVTQNSSKFMICFLSYTTKKSIQCMFTNYQENKGQGGEGKYSTGNLFSLQSFVKRASLFFLPRALGRAPCHSWCNGIHVQQDLKVQLRRIQAHPVLVLPAQATSHPRVLRYPLSRGKSPLSPNYYHPESLLLTDAIPRHKPHQTWEKLFRQTTTLRCRGSPELHTLFPPASQREFPVFG